MTSDWLSTFVYRAIHVVTFHHSNIYLLIPFCLGSHLTKAGPTLLIQTTPVGRETFPFQPHSRRCRYFRFGSFSLIKDGSGCEMSNVTTTSSFIEILPLGSKGYYYYYYY